MTDRQTSKAGAVAGDGLRVLHVGKYLPPFAGGMEHFLADLLQAQGALGDRTGAVVHHERPGAPGLVPGCADQPAIYRVPCFGRLLYAPLSPTFPMWLERAIRRLQPQVLHLHLPNTSAFAALFLARARALPWVVHWHADVEPSAIERRLSLAYRLYRPFEQRLLRRSRRIICTSPPYLEASTALAPWRGRCAVIPLGLARSRLGSADATGATPLAWPGPGLRVLAIGRLTYYKGHEILIQAMAETPTATAVIVGTGERRRVLTRLIERLGLAQRVRLAGFLPEAQVAELFAACDVLCLPSLERTEAFGLVLLEAMHFAKPVVASAIPGSGASWVVQQAGHGLLVPPGDALALAKALQTLARAPEQRRRLGEHGSAALERTFGIKAVAGAVAALYREVLAEA